MIGSEVSLTHQPPFTTRKIPWYSTVRGGVDPRAIVQLEGLGQLKNSMNSSGIEPVTCWLVAYNIKMGLLA
jgi:hypothetical protein